MHILKYTTNLISEKVEINWSLFVLSDFFVVTRLTKTFSI